MIRSSTSPIHRPLAGRPPRGFTLVELLVVVVILALLIAFLLPAINSAIRTGRNASAQAEINQMAAALAQFKTQYGVYPPSRLYLNESGDYSVATMTANFTGLSAAAASSLSQRSVSYLRRIWPRMTLSTTAITGHPLQYDFDGSGAVSPPKILQGAECLVFFLGGIPQVTDNGTFGVTGFAKDPVNPMRSANTALTGGSANRSV